MDTHRLSGIKTLWIVVLGLTFAHDAYSDKLSDAEMRSVDATVIAPPHGFGSGCWTLYTKYGRLEAIWS